MTNLTRIISTGNNSALSTVIGITVNQNTTRIVSSDIGISDAPIGIAINNNTIRLIQFQNIGLASIGRGFRTTFRTITGANLKLASSALSHLGIHRTLTSSALVGDSNIEADTTPVNANEEKITNKFTVPPATAFTKIFLYLIAAYSGDIKFAVYPDSGGSPQGQSPTWRSQGYAVSVSGAGWVEIDLAPSDECSIPASGDYWMMLMADTDSDTDVLVRAHAVTSYWADGNYSAGFPDPLTGLNSETAGPYSMYLIGAAAVNSCNLALSSNLSRLASLIRSLPPRFDSINIGLRSVVSRLKNVPRQITTGTNTALSSSVSRQADLLRTETDDIGLPSSLSFSSPKSRTITGSNMALSSDVGWRLTRIVKILLSVKQRAINLVAKDRKVVLKTDEA